MMRSELQPPLTARNGHTLRVLVPCRVSDPGPGKQDIRSLSDQEALHRRWLGEHTALPVEVTVIASSGSGEYLERAEYLRLIELVESDRFNLVLTEDLGRIVRRIHAHLFCELCVDHRVRLIALNDHVDTAQPGWQDRSIFSAWHHERSNRDTSDRIKRTHRNRFLSGGCASLPFFGYRKKAGAKSDEDWEKVPEATPVYAEWFRRLDNGATYSEVADWLNASGVPTGPYCRQAKWDGRMVSRVTHHWLLKGLRFRNKRKTRRLSSGKYKSEKAGPSDLITRKVPHLAFFDEAYYDRVVAKADARNARYRRNGKGGPDPCENRPKKRVRFPGQAIVCGVCGRGYVFGGHGQRDHLECSGAREYACWNGITVDGRLAAARISAAVLEQIESLGEFDSAFLDLVHEESCKQDSARQARLREIALAVERHEQEIANVLKFIRGGDDSPSIRAALRDLEKSLQELRHEADEINAMIAREVVVPPVDEIKRLARQSFRDLAIESFEFAKLMRELAKPILVYPFRLCDGGHIVLRARFRLELANLMPDRRAREALRTPLTRTLVVDLFDAPERAKHRERIMELRRAMNEREAARQVGITVTAAQRAAALDRRMRKLGLADPYVHLTEPPADYTKLRRHLHPRYRFNPLPGSPCPW